MFMHAGMQLGFAFLAEFCFAKNNSLPQNQKFSKFAYALPHLTIVFCPAKIELYFKYTSML